MEKWVDIKGYEGLYMISDQGNIKALPKKLHFAQDLRGSTCKKGGGIEWHKVLCRHRVNVLSPAAQQIWFATISTFTRAADGRLRKSGAAGCGCAMTGTTAQATAFTLTEILISA